MSSPAASSATSLFLRELRRKYPVKATTSQAVNDNLTALEANPFTDLEESETLNMLDLFWLFMHVLKSISILSHYCLVISNPTPASTTFIPMVLIEHVLRLMSAIPDLGDFHADWICPEPLQSTPVCGSAGQCLSGDLLAMRDQIHDKNTNNMGGVSTIEKFLKLRDEHAINVTCPRCRIKIEQLTVRLCLNKFVARYGITSDSLVRRFSVVEKALQTEHCAAFSMYRTAVLDNELPK